MQIIWTRGESRGWGIVPRDPAGAPTGSAYDQAELRLNNAGICIPNPGRSSPLADALGNAPGFIFDLTDATLGAVAVGRHRFAIWLRSSGGWQVAVDAAELVVKEGC